MMAEDASESWKNPTNIMRRQLLKRKSQALLARFSNAATTVETGPAAESSLGMKRSNPFRQSPSKRVKLLSSEEPEAATDASMFQLLNSTPAEKPVLQNMPLNFSAFLSKKSSSDTQAFSQESFETFTTVPIDWSLKTRMRVTSKEAFPWNRTLRTSEEASGITSFCRCLSVTDSSSSMASIDTGTNAQFHQRCLYWQHPSIPWMTLYPRTNKQGGNPLLTEEAQESLFKDWQESIRSAITLVRACQCPYIYVCASSFVLLLRAAGIAEFEEIHALITPTTRGLRQLLTQEDIEFSMPFKGGRKLDLSGSAGDDGENGGSNQVAADTANSDNEEGDGATDWLEEMGLTASSLPALKSKDKTELEKQREIDGFPESTLLIEGSPNILSLMNFLMTTKAHLSSTGPLAGVPPTILSPVAFSGATLKNHKVRQGESRVNGEDHHYVELAGPVLPSAVQSLCDLLKDNLHDFEVTTSVLNVSKPLAVGVKKASGASVFGVENLSDCGLSEKLLRRFCAGSDGRKWMSGFSLKQRKYKPGCP